MLYHHQTSALRFAFSCFWGFLAFACPATGQTQAPAGAEPAYRLALVVDSDAAYDRAQGFRQFLNGTPPFSHLRPGQLIIEVIRIDPALTHCRQSTVVGWNRHIECNQDAIAQAGAHAGAHKTAMFTSHADFGSSGRGEGAIPIASIRSSPNLGYRTLLHELGHSWNLGDEYEILDPAEINARCNRPGRWPNIMTLRPRPPYASDNDARSRHWDRIPWYSQIAAETPITTGDQLGTPPSLTTAAAASEASTSPVGLYRGGFCNRVTPTWRAIQEQTLMGESMVAHLPPLHQRYILSAMQHEVGHVLALTSPLETPAARNTGGAGPAPEAGHGAE